jgi:hypothetical protein
MYVHGYEVLVGAGYAAMVLHCGLASHYMKEVRGRFISYSEEGSDCQNGIFDVAPAICPFILT